MISATNLVVRRRFGDGPGRSRSTPTATWCRRARAGPTTPTAPRSSTAGCTAAASRSRSPTSPPTPSRCSRSRRRRAAPPARHGRAALHLRRGGRRRDRPAAGCSSRASASPTSRIAAGFSYAVVTAHNGCLHLEVAGRRPLGPRRDAVHRRRRAGGRDARSWPRSTPGARRWRSGVSAIAGIGTPAADGRPDQGRHQHQRRARPGRLPARPAHDARRRTPEAVEAELRQVIAEAAPGLPRGQGRGAPHPAGPSRSCRSPGGERSTELLCRHATRDHGRAGGRQGRAALHRRAPLRRGGMPIVLYGAGPHTHRGGQRASRRRAPAARRPAQGRPRSWR